ncbi:MAG: glycoside hydrolase family 3 N-terminal domain-containing protein, partial [Bacteroidales bacterium]
MTDNKILATIWMVSYILAFFSCTQTDMDKPDLDMKVDSLLDLMTIEEKIGQTYQVSGTGPEIEEQIKKGAIGSVLNVVDPEEINGIQQIAMEESRLGIPLIVGRDVIHGFKTIFPIPLGQAATWNPELVEKGASIAASEAASVGIRWTFAPML